MQLPGGGLKGDGHVLLPFLLWLAGMEIRWLESEQPSCTMRWDMLTIL